MRLERLRLRWLAAIAHSPRFWAVTLVSVAFFTLGGAANASKTTVVKPNTLIELAGTDTYCSVLTEAKIGTTVACFHDPGGPSSNVRKGWAVAAADKLVVVEPAGSTTPIKAVKEPSFAKVPAITGGTALNLLVLHLNDVAEVAGTHMAIAAKPALGGGAGLVLADINPQGQFIVGSYGVGIGGHFVAITKAASPSPPLNVVYQHPVYGK
jgi:hypothetical protein